MWVSLEFGIEEIGFYGGGDHEEIDCKNRGYEF